MTEILLKKDSKFLGTILSKRKKINSKTESNISGIMLIAIAKTCPLQPKKISSAPTPDKRTFIPGLFNFIFLQIKYKANAPVTSAGVSIILNMFFI